MRQIQTNQGRMHRLPRPAKWSAASWVTWDPEHPEQLEAAKNHGPTCGTLWEVHQVHKIEVKTGGKWKALE